MTVTIQGAVVGSGVKVSTSIVPNGLVLLLDANDTSTFGPPTVEVLLVGGGGGSGGGGQTGYTSGGGGGYRFGVGLDGCYVLVGGSGYSELGIAFNSPIPSTTWNFVTMVFDRAGTNTGGTAQWQLHLNGVAQTTTNMVANQTSALATVTPGLVRSACCGLYTGKIGMFGVYNRALTTAEALQNYNATKGVYGL